MPLDTPEQLGLRVAHWVAGEEPIYRPGPSAACLIAASNNTLRCLRIAHSAALVLIFLAIALISCSSARRAGVFMLIAAPMCSVAMSIAEHRTITRQPTSKPAPTNSQGDAA